jgi:hypothetical protein
MALPQPAQRLGFLRSCIDRRFVEATRSEFERLAGLAPTDFWHEAYAGGSALPPANTIGEDYAASHGATIFGWQAHIDHCGAFPPPPENRDEEIRARLQATFAQKIKQYEYLHATHYALLAKLGPDGTVAFERWEHHPQP